MIRVLWTVPGVVLALGYLAWVLAVRLSAGQWSHDLAAALMVLPFFAWLAASSHQLRSVGRPWWTAYVAPMFLFLWVAYALLVVPFLLGAGASVGGSQSLGLIVNGMFAGSIVLTFDHVAFAIPRAERAMGRRRAGYVVTLLQLLFPPIALWVAHSRIAAVGEKVRANV